MGRIQPPGWVKVVLNSVIGDSGAAVNPSPGLRLAGPGRVALLAVVALSLALTWACQASVPAPASRGETGPGQLSGDLTVFAAASLSQAFTQLADAFTRQHPAVSVRLNFDGSQRLRTQLEHGAQADLFASADWRQMDGVVNAGLVPEKPVNFAANRPVFLVHAGKEQDAATTTTMGAIMGLNDLARPGVKILLAVPEAPAGRYAQEVIDRMGRSPKFGPAYREGLLANVVSREINVRSVAQKVALGEADAGIAYQTDALTPAVAPRVRTLAIPPELNVTAHYPIAKLENASPPAQPFIDFVRSETGRAILEQYGFEPPLPSPAGPSP